MKLFELDEPEDSNSKEQEVYSGHHSCYTHEQTVKVNARSNSTLGTRRNEMRTENPYEEGACMPVK